MKTYLGTLLLFIFSLEFAFAGEPHKRFHYDYKKFGLYGSFGIDSQTYDGSNDGPQIFEKRHFGLTANFYIEHGVNLDDTVELSYFQDDFYLKNKAVLKRSTYFFDFGKERRDSFSPYFSILEYGHLGAFIVGSSDINTNDFIQNLAPAFRYLSISNTPAHFTALPRLLGGGLKGSFSLGVRLTPLPLVSFDTLLGVYGTLNFMSITGTDLYPTLNYQYGLEVTQKVLFTIDTLEPWIAGKFNFFETEGRLGNVYTASQPFKWSILLGIQFRFSLLLFG